ncbi:Cysteine-rich repeat secretory protein 38 [Camellia lanceoleosa]|uniref:Cysteine-rich repeat secretory protein 38 n=1 Tax=Camellia lanceoleosa TaxID=1840588 RepID=A0ACC0GJ82_9ERIC|nr:Cysteine-rich repeat secretory protein 38 [Camellia lanceoleosa]
MYGLYLCRSDAAPDMCQKCVEAAIQEIQQPAKCRSNKWATIWYDKCMLRYSVDNFFGTAETYPRVWMWNVENTTSPDDPNYLALDLMSRMKLKVLTQPIMYEHEGLAMVIDVTRYRYGMAQSIGDISGKAYFRASSLTPPVPPPAPTTLSKGSEFLDIN